MVRGSIVSQLISLPRTFVGEQVNFCVGPKGAEKLESFACQDKKIFFPPAYGFSGPDSLGQFSTNLLQLKFGNFVKAMAF